MGSGLTFSPHASYHVMLRGNDGQPIFFSEEDKYRMCLLLQQGIERFDHRIEAFCFMSNHIHLAIRIGNISISQIIHHLAFRYTGYVNRLYKRIGHLFQGRFKSILIEDETYLKELIRYIHLNPVRAGLTTEPLKYPWSSHRDLFKTKTENQAA
jgi:REP element-mobilizing transposase RayT